MEKEEVLIRCIKDLDGFEVGVEYILMAKNERYLYIVEDRYGEVRTVYDEDFKIVST